MFTTIDSTRFLNKRLQIVSTLLILIILSFAIKLFNLQIVKGALYQNQAKRVSEHTVTLPAQRGLVFDRNGELLAGNTEMFSIQIIPAEIIDKNQIIPVLERIADTLNLPSNAFNSRIPEHLHYARAPIELTREVSLEKITYFSSNIDDFPGLYWGTRAKRNYLIEQNGKTVNHVIGYTGDITTEELQILYNQGYTANDTIGKSGVEHYADRILRGKSGQRSIKVDAVGRRLGENEEAFITPVNGKNIELTIDMRIQRLAEEALGERRGSVIVLKPTSGEVLAMVSYPVFNANKFSSRGDRGFASQAIDNNFPFINRAISAEYPPASPFKVAMAAAILESGRVSPFFQVRCNGSIVVGNMRFRCHARGGHGLQDLNAAVANSCNVYFWTIIKKYVAFDESGNASNTPLVKAAKEFGYGLPTGIDLAGEKLGIVPTQDWKEETYHSPWTGGDTLNMSIGQGFMLTTLLQAANAMAIVPNEGIIYRPHVIRATIDPLTGERSETGREVLHRSTMKKDTWQKLQRYTRSTVTSGTGWMLNRIVPVAGKTGTAETGIEGSYHDWFTAYAPYNATNPEDVVVVAVMLEANEEYAWWSTKIADLIIQGIFANQSYSEVLRTLQPSYINWRATPEVTPPPSVIIPSRIIGSEVGL